MTKEKLKELGLTDEQIAAVMPIIEQETSAVNTQLEGLITQLTERDKDITALKASSGNSEALNAKITELQSKYDKDTADLTAKLEGQTYDYAADKFFDGYKFSSNAARKAAIADFKAKGIKLKDGKFEGADEFITGLKKDDPAAFVAEDADGKPIFTTGGTGGSGGTPDPFDAVVAQYTPKK
jgi:hypothetical protein